MGQQFSCSQVSCRRFLEWDGTLEDLPELLSLQACSLIPYANNCLAVFQDSVSRLLLNANDWLQRPCEVLKAGKHLSSDADPITGAVGCCSDERAIDYNNPVAAIVSWLRITQKLHRLVLLRNAKGHIFIQMSII